jgi:hypothetical protein
MFAIALLIVVIFLLVWAALVYLRKTMWDAVHRNLLDLEDKYEGKVFRRGFASRPIFHGKYKDAGLTVNFSSERSRDGRRTYIDISYERSASIPLTVSNKEWLDKQDAQDVKDYEIVKNRQTQEFLVMPVSNDIVKDLTLSRNFLNLLDDLEDLAYIFIGKTGMICEFISEQIVPDTKIEIFEKRIGVLDNLINEIKAIKA